MLSSLGFKIFHLIEEFGKIVFLHLKSLDL